MVELDLIDAALIGGYGGVCNFISRAVSRKYSISSLNTNISGLIVTLIGSVLYAKLGASVAIPTAVAVIVGFKSEIKAMLKNLFS